MLETPARIEPCFFEDQIPRVLADLMAEIQQQAAGLGRDLHPDSAAELAEFVRVMNCYYSNLIEGHNTRPRDIERALRSDYSRDPERRKLQLEAVAHIHVQSLIDRGQDPPAHPISTEYLLW